MYHFTENDMRRRYEIENFNNTTPEARAAAKAAKQAAIDEAITNGLPWETNEELNKMTRAEAVIVKAQIERDNSVTATASDPYVSARYKRILRAHARNYAPQGVTKEELAKRTAIANEVAAAIRASKPWETKSEIVAMTSDEATARMNAMIAEYGTHVIKRTPYLLARYQRLAWVTKRGAKPVTTPVTAKKEVVIYDRRAVMTRAWEYRRALGVTMSDALKRAWAEHKEGRF